MTDWVRRALTRKIAKKGPRGHLELEEVSEKLVYTVKFALTMTGFLTALEIAHLAFLHSWSSEIFAAITGLMGTVSGVLIGRRA